DDVEAELRELRQDAPHAREPAPRARKELVPGAEAGERAIDVDLERGRPDPLVAVAGLGRQRVLHGQALAPEQQRALGELARDVLLPGLDLAPKLVLERCDAVDPRLDPVTPAAAAVDGERAGPPVVAGRRERRLLPARSAGGLVAHRRAEQLVAVADDRRRDPDAVAARRLDRVAAAVDL